MISVVGDVGGRLAATSLQGPVQRDLPSLLLTH